MPQEVKKIQYTTIGLNFLPNGQNLGKSVHTATKGSFVNLKGIVMELFSRRRWATRSAQQSNIHGQLPWVCHKHKSLPLGAIQPSSPTKELHGRIKSQSPEPEFEVEVLYVQNLFPSSLARCARSFNLSQPKQLAEEKLHWGSYSDALFEKRLPSYLPSTCT